MSWKMINDCLHCWCLAYVILASSEPLWDKIGLASKLNEKNSVAKGYIIRKYVTNEIKWWDNKKIDFFPYNISFYTFGETLPF